MSNQERNKYVDATTLATSGEMFSVPTEKVLDYLCNNLRPIHNLVNEWLHERPLITSPYAKKTYLITEGRKSTAMERERSFIYLALSESVELMKSSLLEKKDPEEVQMEWGDVLFSLMAMEHFDWIRADDLEFTFKRSGFGTKTKDNNATNIPGEMQIHFSLENLNLAAGYQDGITLLVKDNYFVGEEDDDYKNWLPGEIPYEDWRGGEITVASTAVLESLFRYAYTLNWNPLEIMTKVAEKNSQNYPKRYFNENSPFFVFTDSISCLRIFRNRFSEPDFDFEFENEVCTEFSKDYVGGPKQARRLWTYHFRMTVKKQLEEILQTSTNETDKQIIEFLLNEGVWGNRTGNY